MRAYLSLQSNNIIYYYLVKDLFEKYMISIKTEQNNTPKVDEKST